MDEGLKKRLEELEEIEKLYNALFNRTNDAVFLINLDGTHRKVNNKAIQMLGYDAEEIEGQIASRFIADSEINDSASVKEKLLAGESIPIYERIFRRKDGSLFYGENDVTLVRDYMGNPSYFFSIVRDVTERKEARKKLEEMAWFDNLTGVFNRHSILIKINEEVSRSERSRKPFTLLLLDIDFFKSVNDSSGHDCGDYILKEVAQSMSRIIRKQDLCSRWGGEEFLLVLPETDLEGSMSLAEKIREEIASKIFDYGDSRIQISVTIGVSQYQGEDVYECIKRADNALYKGKKSGRNCVVSA